MALELTLPLLYTFLKDGWALVRGRRRAISGTEVLRLRKKWQPPFEDYLVRRRREGLRQDVIVRDVRRIDNYREVEATGKGISPWFRVGLAGTYLRGIKLLLRLEGLCQDKATGQWRYSNHKSGEAQELTAALIGLVRYEAIDPSTGTATSSTATLSSIVTSPRRAVSLTNVWSSARSLPVRSLRTTENWLNRLSKKLGVGYDA